jgi:hypothetical protein
MSPRGEVPDFFWNALAAAAAVVVESAMEAIQVQNPTMENS